MNNAKHTTRRLLLASVFAVFLTLSPILVSPALADLIADPGGPYPGTVGENVHFLATTFPEIVEYRWDFGDGTTDNRPGPSINHKYSSAGTFTVSLIVVDIDGLTSLPATTTATIDGSTTTTTSPTTTTTTSPTTTTTTSPTTTTTPPPPPPTTTTSTPPTTTTSTSTTSTTSATSTTITTTGSSTTTRPTTSTTTNTTQATTTTSDGIGVVAAEGLTATTFSLVPPAVASGGEIALTVTLDSETPGPADLRFLLDGRPLGDKVSVNTAIESTGSGVGAVFTRTLPTDLKSGSYLVEVVAEQRPSVVLASATINVFADLPVAADEMANASPPQKESTKADLTVALAAGSAALMVGAGFGFSTRYRRKTAVRRIGAPDR